MVHALACVQQVEDIISSIGLMLMGIGQSASDSVSAEYLDLCVNFPDVISVVTTLFFQTVKVLLSTTSKGKECGNMPIFQLFLYIRLNLK